jgi:hypothetical protein
LGLAEWPSAQPSHDAGPLKTIFLGRRPLLAVVQKSTDAEQERRECIGIPAEIEEPDSAENAYYDDGYNFEDGVGVARFSGSRAERLAEDLSSQMRRRPTASRRRQAER